MGEEIHPLHFPLSSKVPIRIFRIHLSSFKLFPFGTGFDPSPPSPWSKFSAWSPVGVSTGFFLCASSSCRIESSVTSNPRFPKNNVGPGGCFCVDSILRAVLVRPVLRAPGVDADASGVVAVVPSPSTAVVLAGRPEKSSPCGPQISHERRGRNRMLSPSLINNRRPSRFRSDKVIATSFASGVAKSTYAKLTEGNLMSKIWGWDRQEVRSSPRVYVGSSTARRCLQRHVYPGDL